MTDQTDQSGTVVPLVPYDSSGDTLTHINRVRDLLTIAIIELAYRAQRHDASKLAEPEKSGWDEATPRLNQLTYGTEEYRAALRDIRPLVEHHYSHNDHHPEYYERNGCRGMSLLALIEMLADWKAAGERHADNKGLMASIEYNQKRFGYTPELADILKNTARELGWV